MKKNPSLALRRFFLNNYNENFKGNTAIDLGCGVGNDTEFLISKGFEVTAIDKKYTGYITHIQQQIIMNK